jgi:drug/metabolite transporter (DMT)-like permease
MEPFILGLVLISALLHPIWNALVKRAARPEQGIFALFLVIGLIAGAHAVVTGTDLGTGRRVLPELTVSWAGLVLYGLALQATLRRGDLSVFYPIARSSPLFIVVVGVTLLGHRYSWTMLGGIVMVLAGAGMLQSSRGARFFHDPFVLFWTQILAAPSYGAIVLLAGRMRGNAPLKLPPPRTLPVFFLIGVVAYTSYFLILMAYELGGNVAAVTAVRQASIPFSVLIGGIWLRERAMAGRLGASLLVAAGIVVIVFSR